MKLWRVWEVLVMICVGVAALWWWVLVLEGR